MTQWQVLKRSDTEDDMRRQWTALGTHESESTYSLHYERDLAQSLGQSFGAGEFLLLADEGQRYERLTIGERQDFYEVKEPQTDHDDVILPGLSEGDLTAAEVMARDA